MNNINPTQLRANIYQILDQVLESGIPVEINRAGKKLLISSLEDHDRLDQLERRADVIMGDPEDLVDLHWDEVAYHPSNHSSIFMSLKSCSISS